MGNGSCHSDPSGPAAGLCSLRAAVQEANRTSNPGGATVMLPAGIYALTIPATGGAGDYFGDLNLTTPGVSSQVISIVGAGAESTIIDANQLDRVFSIDTGRSASISRSWWEFGRHGRRRVQLQRSELQPAQHHCGGKQLIEFHTIWVP